MKERTPGRKRRVRLLLWRQRRQRPKKGSEGRARWYRRRPRDNTAPLLGGALKNQQAPEAARPSASSAVLSPRDWVGATGAGPGTGRHGRMGRHSACRPESAVLCCARTRPSATGCFLAQANERARHPVPCSLMRLRIAPA